MGWTATAGRCRTFACRRWPGVRMDLTTEDSSVNLDALWPEREMASATQKIERRRNRKKTAQGSRRKRDIRRDARAKLAVIAKEIGLDTAGQLDGRQESR